MRSAPFLALLFALSSALPAAAQKVAVHEAAAAQAAAPAATAITPAKATSATIIPGSPLAALTGAAPADASSPAPFGTSAIGLSIATTIIGEATKTCGEFISAIEESTRLDPVWTWIQGFSGNPERQHQFTEIVIGLATTMVPGLLLESLIRLGLTRPRASLARRAAAAQTAAPYPAPVPEPDESQDDETEEQSAPDDETGEDRPHRRRRSLLPWLRHAVLALLNFGLALAPLFGFAATVQLLLSAGLLSSRQAQLAVIGITNAFLFTRLVRAFVLFLTAPDAASLRLITMPDARAATVLGWTVTVLITGFLGYVITSVAEILGLPHAAAITLLHLFGLVLHIEAAAIIWHSRRPVRRWISGSPDAKGSMAGFRRWLGRIWVIPALFYVLALWIALAAGVHHAFAVLLRIMVVTALAALFGRLAWSGSSALLERLFPDPSNRTARHPAFAARAHAYNPLIRVIIRVVIAVFVTVLILQGWGLNAFGWLTTNPFSRSLIGACISIIITIAVALILWECSNALLNGRIERLTRTGRTRRASRLRTLLPMIRASLGVSIFLVAGLLCLSKIGVNAAPLLAGAGVLGIAIGFGSQKLVQDIITGLFLLLEDAMQVGDVISLAGMTGTVERLSIRTIRLRGGDGSVNIIPFSAVTTVTNMTRDFGYAQISIQVAYEEDLPRVFAVLTDIARTMRQEPAWSVMMRDDLQLNGLDEFGASALVITGQIRTGPGQHWAVRREFYARVKARFEAEHIEMPYTYLPPAPPRQLPVDSRQLSDETPPPPPTDH